jgi:hypothetical protein
MQLNAKLQTIIVLKHSPPDRRAVILDTSSKSATEIVLRFRPVHKRVVAVPYPDGSANITQSRPKRTGF